MNRIEIDAVLNEIFNDVLNGEGLNYPVTIILKDRTTLYGFKLLENGSDYIIGLTNEQKTHAASHPPIYSATVIMKDSINSITCPMLDAGGIQRQGL